MLDSKPSDPEPGPRTVAEARRSVVAAMIAVASALTLAGCATTAEPEVLSDHAFNGVTGHEVLQLDHYRYTLRYYAAPQADLTAMENLLLDQATRICGFPGFRRTEPVERTVSMAPVRTPDLVVELDAPRPEGPEILHWVEVEVDCDPAYDR
jgi:hypothetical protein